jgi:hypothetical protein
MTISTVRQHCFIFFMAVLLLAPAHASAQGDTRFEL